MLFGIRLDLVQLDHRGDDGLHVRDAPLLSVLLTEGLKALAQGAGWYQRHRTPRLLSRAKPSGSFAPDFAAFKAAARSGSTFVLRHVSGH